MIIPKYAIYWKEIGIGLSLSYEALQIIEADFPKTTERCTNMLVKWLQTDVNATWKKLLQVIDSLAVANSSSSTWLSSHSESKYCIIIISFCSLSFSCEYAAYMCMILMMDFVS